MKYFSNFMARKLGQFCLHPFILLSSNNKPCGFFKSSRHRALKAATIQDEFIQEKYLHLRTVSFVTFALSLISCTLPQTHDDFEN